MGASFIPETTADLPDSAGRRYLSESEKANQHAPGSDAETVTTLGALINSTGGIVTPADIDKIPLRDSAGGLLAHITWANVKAALASAFNSIYEPLRTYTGNVIGTGVSLLNAINALNDALTVIEYPPSTLTVTGAGTVTGAVGDLAAFSGAGVLINEAGTPFSAELEYTGVTLFNQVHLHYRYYSVTANSGHTVNIEIYNWVTTGWDSVLSPLMNNSGTLEVVILNIEDPTAHIGTGVDAGKVRVRFNHVSNGSVNHRLQLKHCVVRKGISGNDIAFSSHKTLSDRSEPDQHVIGSTTGLTEALAALNANSHAAGSDAETVTSLGTLINGTGGITTPADVDKFPMRDSASGLLAHITWANIKAAFNSIFVPKTVSGALTENTFDINTSNLRMFSRALDGSTSAQVRASSYSASLHAAHNYDRLYTDVYINSDVFRVVAQKLTVGGSVLTESKLECKADGTTVLQLIDNSGTPTTVTVVFSQTGVTFNGVRLVTAGDSLVTELRTDLTPTNGSTVTLDLSLGRTFKINATSLAAGNTFTIAVSNIPAGAVVTGVSLILQTGANVPTVTWPAGTTAPTLAASKTLWGTLATENNGTAWRWFKAGEFS